MTRDPDQMSMPSPDPARYDGSVPEPAYRTPHAEHRLREPPLGFDRFHNALRIMLNLDEHELELSRPDWLLYMKDPFRWFIRAPTPEAERIWALIEARQRPAVPDTPSNLNIDGTLALSAGMPGTIRIMRPSGEGGDFDANELAEVISRFVAERM